NIELMLADLETVRRALDRLHKPARRDAEARATQALLTRVGAALENEQPVRALDLSAEDASRLQPYRLLTAKRMLYVANSDEDAGAHTQPPAPLRALAEAHGSRVLSVCARWEAELAELPPGEADAFRKDAGLDASALQRLAHATMELLNLAVFITFNETEVRAWTLPRGATAVEAARAVHTDFAEHFIRAEVVAYDDFDRYGGIQGAREHGRLRIEGRDYAVRDGDVLYFRV
ncbi:MAG: redox-regulated ATPase YchF, partial [Lentisphaerae bacterium]|nr:redox-regulated ATPase YchF [Lentisphaerota bacterium]